LNEGVTMTSQQIRGWAAGGVFAGLLVLSACGSEDDRAAALPNGTPAQTTTPQPAAAVPAALRGSWKRRMTTSDWGGADGYPVGTWRLDVEKSGTVDVYLPGTDAVDFTTRLMVSRGRLTIDTVPICPGETGRYSWRATAEKLTLTVVEDDACAPRAALFGGVWARRR
jgi:hypothetical protein